MAQAKPNTPQYPLPRDGVPGIKRVGRITHGGHIEATLQIGSEIETCEHKHESSVAARDCGWRLRAQAIASGRLAPERVLWTHATRVVDDDARS